LSTDKPSTFYGWRFFVFINLLLNFGETPIMDFIISLSSVQHVGFLQNNFSAYLLNFLIIL